MTLSLHRLFFSESTIKNVEVYPSAGATSAPSAAVFSCISFIKRMPTQAMRFNRITAPQRVDDWWNGIKMGWIHATANAAQVVRMKISGKVPNEHFIRKTLSASLNRVTETRIAFFGISAPYPNPAQTAVERHVRMGNELAEKPRKQSSVYGKSVRIVLHDLVSFVGQIVLGHCGFTSRVALSF